MRTSSYHASYVLGYTRSTMIGTKGRIQRGSANPKISPQFGLQAATHLHEIVIIGQSYNGLGLFFNPHFQPPKAEAAITTLPTTFLLARVPLLMFTLPDFNNFLHRQISTQKPYENPTKSPLSPSKRAQARWENQTDQAPTRFNSKLTGKTTHRRTTTKPTTKPATKKHRKPPPQPPKQTNDLLRADSSKLEQMTTTQHQFPIGNSQPPSSGNKLRNQ
ncbi:hypothetical protein H5410_017375 [Solanum commersonii]|uniref:Uncharacterized protein n=1 Tax=Solanum commersonii TaxID=4109 RepID=A0A9J6A0B5_SOLCO|nr:hypothetical protein H5410_017375 [Solanum commersonii]